jgi:hypothetical protein
VLRIELLELGYAGEARRQAESFVKSVKALNPEELSLVSHVCRALRERMPAWVSPFRRCRYCISSSFWWKKSKPDEFHRRQ